MKLEMDKIVFEQRYEIHEVAKALQEYMERHKGEDMETVRELFDKLDVMDMSW